MILCFSHYATFWLLFLGSTGEHEIKLIDCYEEILIAQAADSLGGISVLGALTIPFL